MAAASVLRPALWEEERLEALPSLPAADSAKNEYNPTPGTGRTGFINVPPNNYPFYESHERYAAAMQADGGQLSEWTGMYNPTAQQAEHDRRAAFQSGVPHGFVAPGDKYSGLATLPLLVVSELHDDSEYGDQRTSDGAHCGGAFWIKVSPKMRVDEVRRVVSEVGGIPPGLQRFCYGGKNLEDPQRTLEQYGVAYWQSKFPQWPLKIRRCSKQLALKLRVMLQTDQASWRRFALGLVHPGAGAHGDAQAT